MIVVCVNKIVELFSNYLPFSYPAAFKIVKSWLGPEAVGLLKLTNKNEIQEYISAEYLPPYMGGTVSILLLNLMFVLCCEGKV